MGNPTPVKLTTFSAGELSPKMLARPDLPIYSRGLRTCENWLPFPQGALQTRPGTRDIASVIDSTVQSRLIPFKVGTTVAYIVEFGAQKYRVYLNNNGTYEVDSDFESAAPWNVPCAQYANKLFDPSAQTSVGDIIKFKPDGTKLYLVDQSTDIIYQYSLSTAWDVTTATYDNKSFNFNSKENLLRGAFFKPDGLAVFIVGKQHNTVYKYTLGTAWDISTAVDASQSFDISGKATSGQDLFFSSDGAEMYVVGDTNDNIDQWTLVTPWDVSSAGATHTLDISGQDGAPRGLFFKTDGTEMYLGGNVNDKVYQYRLSSAWALSSATFKAQTFLPIQAQNVAGISISSDGLIMHVSSQADGKIYQYDLLSETVYTAAQLQDIQYAQSNDVLYLASPSHPPQKLQRGPNDETHDGIGYDSFARRRCTRQDRFGYAAYAGYGAANDLQLCGFDSRSREQGADRQGGRKQAAILLGQYAYRPDEPGNAPQGRFRQDRNNRAHLSAEGQELGTVERR